MSATRWTAAALLAAATISTGSWQTAALAQGGDKYSARLAWVPITGAERVIGKGLATATLAGKSLAISGSFEGLGGPATIARIHQGVAERGETAERTPVGARLVLRAREVDPDELHQQQIARPRRNQRRHWPIDPAGDPRIERPARIAA